MRAASRALCAALLLLVACGPPISVHRVAPRTVTSELERSALNSSRPSLFSVGVLYRWGLQGQFEQDPERTIATLREMVLSGRGTANTVFALAELSFKHADDTHKREYYLNAAVYAWAFLFPHGADERPEALDPRARIAADLYNRAVTQAFVSKDGSHVELRSGSFALPSGQTLAVDLPAGSLVWSNRELIGFVPVAELAVTGLGVRFRQPGIGAPLAAEMRAIDPAQYEKDYIANTAALPVTAVLGLGDVRARLADPTIDATLEIYSAYDTRTIEIDDEAVPLEVEPSAALAYSLSRSPVWAWELRGFLLGDLLRQETKTSLALAEPYRPGRIPVVFVHGTASSPGRWADMLNVLSNSRSLRGRFQYWFFFYETGNPLPYSAMRLRDTLADAVHRLDPDGTDPALQQMVVVGHSQGGLLTKMTAIDSGDRFWSTISPRPLEQMNVSPETRDLLQRTMFIKPLPFVRRLVFISTPHHGSYVAAYSLAHLVSRFARLPGNVLAAAADIFKGNPDALAWDPRHPEIGSVYGMTPGSPFIKALAAMPIAPGVVAHSIIPVSGGLPPGGQGDGVVKYESAHVDGVASELVVPNSGHSVQGNPAAIEELRRILVEHADETCRSLDVACERTVSHREVVRDAK